MIRLWGDNFYSAKDKKWNKIGGEGYARGFVCFVLDPIYKMFDAVMGFKKEQVDKLMEKLEIKLNAEDKDLDGKAQLKVVYVYLFILYVYV